MDIETDNLAYSTAEWDQLTPNTVEPPMDQSARETGDKSEHLNNTTVGNENDKVVYKKLTKVINNVCKGNVNETIVNIPTVNIEDYIDCYETEEYLLVNPLFKGKPDADRTELRYVCKVCSSYRTTDPQALQKHVALHVRGKLNCEFCDFVASTYNLLVSHQRRLHMNDIKRDFACSQCEFKARNKITLDDHYGKVHSKPSHCCRLCESRFTTINEMKEHRLQKHADSTWYCSKCREIFLAEHGYKQHMERRVCDREKVTCTICGCVCPHSQQLKDHIRRIHTKVHNLKCEMCSYTTGNSDLLKNHVRAQHLKIHPYRCTECPFSCVKAWQLTSHSRTHSGDRPYKCDMCQYRCAWNVQLKKHKKAHESLAQQSCDKCNIVFTNVTLYNKHVRKVHHTDDAVICVVSDSSHQVVSKPSKSPSTRKSTLAESVSDIEHVETGKMLSEGKVTKQKINKSVLGENKKVPCGTKKSEAGIHSIQTNCIEPALVGLSDDAAGSPYPANISSSRERTDVGTVTEIADWKKDIISLNHHQFCKKTDPHPQPVRILRNVYAKHAKPQVLRIRKPEIINECKNNSKTQLESQVKYSKPVTDKLVNRKSKASSKSRRAKSSLKRHRSKAALKVGSTPDQCEIQTVCADMPYTVLTFEPTPCVQSNSLVDSVATTEMSQSSVPQTGKQLPAGVKFFIYPKKSDGHCLAEGKEYPVTLYEVNPETTVDPFGNVVTQMEPISDSFFHGLEQTSDPDMDIQDDIATIHNTVEQKGVSIPIEQYSHNGASKEIGYTMSNPLSVRTSGGVITLYNNLNVEDGQFFPGRMDVGGTAASCVGDHDPGQDMVVIQMQDDNVYNVNTDVLANLQSGDWIAAPVPIGENVTDQSVLEYLSTFPLTETSGTSIDSNSSTMHENMSSQYDKPFTNLDENETNIECENSMDDMLETCSIQCMQITQNCVDRALDGSDNTTLSSCDEESLFPVQDIACDSSYNVMNL